MDYKKKNMYTIKINHGCPVNLKCTVIPDYLYRGSCPKLIYWVIQSHWIPDTGIREWQDYLRYNLKPLTHPKDRV